MTEKESIIVTGAAGFLGWNFVRLLTDEPKFAPFRKTIGRIRCLDLLEPPFKSLKNEEKIVLEFEKTDITNPQLVKQVTKGGFHAIFHFAGLVSMSSYAQELLTKINVLGTKILVEAALENNIPRFLYTSSVEIIQNGQDQYNIDEETPLRAITPYGQSKIAAENYLRTLKDAKTKDGSPFEFIIIRPSGIYGEADTMSLRMALVEAKKGRYIIRFGDGSAKYTFIYVGNVSYAFLFMYQKLKQNPELSGEAFYFNDETAPMNSVDLQAPYLKYHGYPIPSYKVPIWFLLALAFILEWIAQVMKPFYKFQPDLTVPIVQVTRCTWTVNDAKARKIGWKPIFSFEEASQRTLEYYKDPSNF